MAVEKDDGDQAVMDDVFSSGRDRGADSAAPESEAKAEAPPPAPKEEPKAADAEPKGDDSQKQYRDPETGRFVPLTELKSEREKRQEAQRLREEAQREAAYWRGQAEAASRNYGGQQQQPRQQQQQQITPEQLEELRWSDPQRYDAIMLHRAEQIAEAKAEQIYTRRIVDRSKHRAERTHGAEKVREALQAVASVNPALCDKWVTESDDPFEDLMNWHAKTYPAIKDPAAYEAEIEARVLARLKGTQPAGQQPAAQRFPGTLADATGSGPQGAMAQSDESMMGEIFGSGRRSARRR